ncbi:hypothetical protein [Exiguobacterium sp. RIT341]|uniref:hypothetical protein n=1 Tax=Exiguobacterium sp. RIT341 TaxID=1470592 RepID=UPI0004453FAA|nr:hypothetical protein [Exiguobacterium sp. RIT341]EZP58355.1 hypothetical protein BW42_03037 [Exiguobacterium sp. RIT341]
MNSKQKWFLAIASLFLVFFVTFLIVYKQPSIQATPPLQLKLQITPIDKGDADSAIEYQTNGFKEEIIGESDPNVRIDLFREYLIAVVKANEFNAQEIYEGRQPIDNVGINITNIMGAVMTAKIEHDTTSVFERHDDYEGISYKYFNLLEASHEDGFTKEQQQEAEKAQLKFEAKGQELIDVVDQLYP